MPQLSVVVPTFNESANVAELHRRVAEALAGSDGEMIFVDDDSPDATADTVRALAQQDPRVRCLQRIGRRGLGLHVQRSHQRSYIGKHMQRAGPQGTGQGRMGDQEHAVHDAGLWQR